MAAPGRCVRFCKRSLAFYQRRCYSQASTDIAHRDSDGDNPLYPAIKPKYPPGKWGGMERSYAWLWHKHQEDNLAIPDVQKRISALCQKEMNQLVVRVKDPRPRTLEFKKYVTKTHTISGLPDIYNNALDSSLLEELTSKLTPLVCDLIAMETDQALRKGLLKKFKTARDHHQHQICHALVRSLIRHLTAQLAADFPHLLTTQYDESVNVSAFWDRDGIKRTRTRMVNPDYFKFDEVDDHCMTAQTFLDFVLRASQPLPEFASRDAAPSVGDFPSLDYSPVVYGQKLQIKGQRSMQAGHVWGDPCEFGSLGVVNTVWTHQVGAKYGEDHAEDCQLAQGITSAFTWLVAQAANQGFNTLIELTYPLTTQLALTDGQTWQFLTYQLNTLHLWKDQEANDARNLCWLGPRARLFDKVQGGKVQGFEPAVLKQLIACLILEPAARPYELRPTLPPSSHPPQAVIPGRGEERVVEVEETFVVE